MILAYVFSRGGGFGHIFDVGASYASKERASLAGDSETGVPKADWAASCHLPSANGSSFDLRDADTLHCKNMVVVLHDYVIVSASTPCSS